ERAQALALPLSRPRGGDFPAAQTAIAVAVQAADLPARLSAAEVAEQAGWPLARGSAPLTDDLGEASGEGVGAVKPQRLGADRRAVVIGGAAAHLAQRIAQR